MKKNYEFDYFPKTNNNTIFQFPYNKKHSLNNIDKWSKLEQNLQKNRVDNYFSNDTFLTLNLGTLKSMEWDDDYYINNHSIQKNNININRNCNFFLSLQNLEKIIHPIDDSFENFIQNKLEQLEELKNKNNKKLDNNSENNLLNIKNDNIKKDNINNNFLFNEKKDEKSIIKEKNEAILIFNKNYIDNNNDEYEQNRTKSFLADYIDNNNNTSILNTNKKYDSNLGNRNISRLNKLLNRIKNDNKKETKLINKPNKFKIMDNSEQNSNLDKIQKRYYDQLREEDKHKDNEYIKDYFSTIIYELNQGK